MMKKFYSQITDIRGIFCIIIALYHLLFHYRGIESSGFIPNISVVWGCFFVISGIFLHIETPVKFWKSKLKNIIVPYLLAVTIIGGLRVAFEVDCPLHISTILLNYLIFPTIFGVEFVDGAHWFVVKLIYFFVIYWLAASFDKKKMRIILFLVYLGCSISIFFSSSSNIIAKVFYIIFDPRLLFLLLGINLKEYIYNREHSCLAYVCANMISIYIWFTFSSHWSNCFYFSVLLIFIFLAMREKLRFIDRKFLLSLGESSYFIYLFHQRIGFMIIDLFDNFYFGSFVALVLVVSFAIFFNYCYKNFSRKYMAF